MEVADALYGITMRDDVAAILIAAAPASFLLETGKLGYHRGASWIKSAFP